MLMAAGLLYLLVISAGTVAGCLAAATCLAGLCKRSTRAPAAVALAAGIGGAFAVVASASVIFLLSSSPPPSPRERIWILWSCCGFALGAVPTGVFAVGIEALRRITKKPAA